MSQQTPYSAGLARRLAEAADGLRDSKYYYFVSMRNFPFELKAAQGNTAEEASDAADDLLAEFNNGKSDNLFEKFGPYWTALDFPAPLTYDQIEIRFLSGNTVQHTQTLGSDTDAVILSLSAFDKFFLPYFTRLYGATQAANMRVLASNVLSADPLSSDPIPGMPAGTPKMIVYHRRRTLTLEV